MNENLFLIGGLKSLKTALLWQAEQMSANCSNIIKSLLINNGQKSFLSLRRLMLFFMLIIAFINSSFGEISQPTAWAKAYEPEHRHFEYL